MTTLLGPDAQPLYLRVADDLRADLARETVGGGARLPSERRLMERLGVSRATIRAALNELKRQGVLVSLPARGWVVAHNPGASAGPLSPERVKGFSDLAAGRHLRTRSRILESRTRPATTREAEVFRTVSGVELFEMRRVRFLNDLEIAVEHNRLLLAVAPAMAETDFSVTSLYSLLRAADPPQYPRYADYSVEARNATEEERALLRIDGPVPILSAEQLTFNQNNEPIEWTVQSYRGDRYTFRASITD